MQNPQQLADAMSGLQLTENVAQTECSNDNALSEEINQPRGEPDFPHAKLAMLDEKISSPRWVVPVLPEQELECLLQASIDLCKKGNYRNIVKYFMQTICCYQLLPEFVNHRY